jgi:hypothetical protein
MLLVSVEVDRLDGKDSVCLLIILGNVQSFGHVLRELFSSVSD